MSSGRLDLLAVGPGSGFVVAGAGFQAAVQDADDGAHAGPGPVDLGVRVLAKMVLHLPLQGLDLLIQRGDHRDQRADPLRERMRQDTITYL